MRLLIEKLRHCLARSGQLEGLQPWAEVNVGAGGAAQVVRRSPQLAFEARRLTRMATGMSSWPGGTQIMISLNEDGGFVVTANPLSAVPRALKLLRRASLREAKISSLHPRERVGL